VRAATFREDVGSIRPVIDAMIRYKHVLGAGIAALRQDNGNYGHMIVGLLEAGRIDEAAETVRLYARLTSALPAGVEDGTLGMLAEPLAAQAFDQNRPDLLRDLVDIIEDLIAACEPGSFGSDNASLGAVVCVQSIALERGQPMPWRRLSATPLAPDDPRVEDAVRRAPAARFAQWFSFTWEGDPKRTRLVALKPRAG
jgi:hypothetical protein